jgi:hypothetical protein
MKYFLCLNSFSILHSLFDIRYSLFVAFIDLTHCGYLLNSYQKRPLGYSPLRITA